MLRESKYRYQIGNWVLKRIIEPLGLTHPILHRLTGMSSFRGGTYPRDVFLTGFPKSGTTWLQLLVAGIVFDLNLEKAPLQLVHHLVPGTGRRYFHRIRKVMYFKTHFPPRPALKRVIFIVRDGRDVMVSYANHIQAVKNKPVDIMDVVMAREYIEPNNFHWHQYVDLWLRNPYQADMLVLRYEDLVADPLTQLKKICDFIEEDVTSISLQEKIAQTAFSNLKEKESREGNLIRKWQGERTFFRSGKTGVYQGAMPPEALEAFLGHSRKTLEHFGYPIDL